MVNTPWVASSEHPITITIKGHPVPVWVPCLYNHYHPRLQIRETDLYEHTEEGEEFDKQVVDTTDQPTG